MSTPNMLEKAIWLKLFSLSCMPSVVLGNVYYVHGFTGLDTNDGLTPNSPFLTITHALTLCVNDHDDYIIVMEHWQEVVTINKTRVHIIGVGGNPNHSFVQMNAAADTAIFIVSSNSNNSEIAGFSFGGGANHAGIENAAGTPMGLYIHDCQFGHVFAGDTPQDGIRIGANATNIRIERCSFYGNEGKGTMTRDGIRWVAGDPLNGTIINNQFIGLPAVGINFLGAIGIGSILDNFFYSPVASLLGAGWAITLNGIGTIVSNNRASCTGDATGNNPYRDASGAGVASRLNGWSNNYWGPGMAIAPA